MYSYNKKKNKEWEQMVLGSDTDESNDNTSAGSDLIPPAPWPNCGGLNMESGDAGKTFHFLLPEDDVVW